MDAFKAFDHLPLREGSRKATRLWADQYKHRTHPNAHKGATLRSHRKGK